MSDLRPSFEERDKYLGLLGKHYADGRLDEAEFERRSDSVLKAVTHRDAMLQFEGLPKPNIVPVQGYRPPPGPRYEPQPYQPLPAKTEPKASMDRRGFLVAGAIGLGVVGLIGWANVTSVRGGVSEQFPVATMGPEEYYPEPPIYSDPIGATWDVTSLCHERGWDHYSSFEIVDGVLSATALAIRNPGVIATLGYTQSSGEPPQVLSVGDGEAANTISVDELSDAVTQTFDRAQMELGMDVTADQLDFALEWANGQPRYRWTTPSGGYMVFNSMMEMVEMKR